MRKTKRGIAILLTVVMLLMLLPMSALAANVSMAPVSTLGNKAEPDTAPASTGSTSNPVQTQSMMPLKEQSVELDMTGYLPDEMKAVSPETLAGWIEARTGKKLNGRILAWKRAYTTSDYSILGEGDTIDLTSEYIGNTTSNLELIVGDRADQLNLNNERYLLNVRFSSFRDTLSAAAVTADSRSPINVYYLNRSQVWNGTTGVYEKNVIYIYADENDWTSGPAYVGFYPSEQFSDLSAKIYLGYYESENEIPADAQDYAWAGWNLRDLSSSGGLWGEYGYKRGYAGMPELTFVFQRGGSTVAVVPAIVYMTGSGISVSWSGPYKVTETNDSYVNYDYVTYRSSSSTDRETGVRTRTSTLYAGYPANGSYTISLSINNPAERTTENRGIKYVEKAVLGDYATLESAIGAEDIKSTLFGSVSRGGGYTADYSNGVNFTVFLTDGTVERMKFVTVEGDVERGGSDTYFYVHGATKAAEENGYREYYSTYTMPDEADSYYRNGYQTVFLLNRNRDYSTGKENISPVTDTTIIPTFGKTETVEIYVGHDGASGVKQISGETEVPFTSGKPIQYSAAAEDGANLQNYWVTFVTQQQGPKLYVNAANDESRYVTVGEAWLPQREVLLLDDYDYHHDVFFANIGDTDITGLYVKLENPQSVKLDDYWNIGETTTLSAFTTTESRDSDGSYANHGELANFAKVRLQPVDENAFGVIDGVLVIGYTGGTGEEVRIKLTGVAGTPKITTDTVVGGIKYVPYSSVIQTNNMYQTDAITFSVGEVKTDEDTTLNAYFGLDEDVTVTQGLPAGLTIRPNGEIYGLPTETGTFAFTVNMAYQSGSVSLSDSRAYTLTIVENTDENVESANHDAQGYPVLDYMSDESAIFRSEGPFGDFMEFYVDGRKLAKGVDYNAEEGSTRVTLADQVKANLSNGSHTIAAEFRTGGTEDGTLKRSAQNVQLSAGRTSGTPAGGGATGSGSAEGSGAGSAPGGHALLPGGGSSAGTGAAGTGGETYYTVLPGDSLWLIAKKFYGDPNRWGDIYYANYSLIQASNLIYPGQVLRIP